MVDDGEPSRMELEDAEDLSSEHIEQGDLSAMTQLGGPLMTIQVVRCRTAKHARSLNHEHRRECTGVSFSDAGVPIVVDDSICALQAHAKDCFSIAVVAERWLASGGEDDVAFLWDQNVSGRRVLQLNDCNDLEWICWHTTSDILFAGDKDGIVWMWLIGPSGVAQSKVYSGNGSSCTDGSLLPDGRRLLAGYADGAVRLWNLKDGTFTMLNLSGTVTAIHHHISQPIAAVGTEIGTVHVINTSHSDRLSVTVEFPALSPPKEVDEEEANLENCVECAQFAPFNSWLAVGRNDGTLCIYETTSSAPRSIYRAPSPQAMVRALWSMEGNTPFLCVGSVDCFVRIFDARDGSLYKMTYYQMYRNTTLGEALQKTLDDLVHEQMIPPQLAVKVLAIYDKAINKALAQKAKNKIFGKKTCSFLFTGTRTGTMAYMMYRETTLGSALSRTLDEFVEEGLITRPLAMKVLTTFDKNINKALAYRVKNKIWKKNMLFLFTGTRTGTMAYMMYRETTLGSALSRTLDEFVEEGLITRPLAMKVLTTFDKNINKALAYRVKNKVQFKADKLVTYRYCDNVWTFVINGVEFRDVHRSIDRTVDRVKIVACDGRAPGLAGTTSGTM
ncbi:Transcription initiation factor IIA, gamma subunit, helical domain protein [Ostertagia ostertagi]